MNSPELQLELERYRESAEHYRILMNESMDPIFSFYPDGTYRYVNNAFAKGVGKAAADIIGRKIWDLFEKEEADKRFAIVKKVFEEKTVEEIEVRVPLPSGDTYYLTTAKPILNDTGKVETVICISKNITRRKIAEINLKKEHDLLLRAMERIRTLSGLLPICAACKKIRDDKGYWNQLESYIEEHSEVSFSHGMCTDCSDKLYGDQDWYVQMKKKK
ncbi:MAG: PAS domain S-box protein [Desulfobacteraceae bacterium]|nr:MAG: PAS domain S-box protein [Desulfobacteraceae bacterium]